MTMSSTDRSWIPAEDMGWGGAGTNEPDVASNTQDQTLNDAEGSGWGEAMNVTEA